MFLFHGQFKSIYMFPGPWFGDSLSIVTSVFSHPVMYNIKVDSKEVGLSIEIV